LSRVYRLKEVKLFGQGKRKNLRERAAWRGSEELCSSSPLRKEAMGGSLLGLGFNPYFLVGGRIKGELNWDSEKYIT